MPLQFLSGTRRGAVVSSLVPSFQRELSRMLDQFRTGFPIPEVEAVYSSDGTMFPAIDVVETEDAMDISTALPGLPR